MSDPRQYIRNTSGELLGYSKFGVLWNPDHSSRLGEFFAGKIYNDAKIVIAELELGKVITANGALVGEVKSVGNLRHDIYRHGQWVGYHVGDDILSAAAALMLIFDKLEKEV